jgi:hypothetical protein
MPPSLPALPAAGSSEGPRAPTAFQLLCGSRPARNGSSSKAGGGAPLQLSIPRAIDISGFAEFFPSADGGELGARTVSGAAMPVGSSVWQLHSSSHVLFVECVANGSRTVLSPAHHLPATTFLGSIWWHAPFQSQQ